jgi:hypothetical protein
MNLSEIRLEALTDTLRIGKISDQEYFSQKYSAYVSNSRLGLINPEQNGSPEKFFNPIGNIYSDSLILGSAVHTKVLQSEFFDLVQIERPNAKLGFVCDYIWDHSGDSHEITDETIYVASEAVGYYKDTLNDKRIKAVKDAYAPYYRDRIAYKAKAGIEPMFLSPKMYETAMGCIEACQANDSFRRLMYPDYMLKAPISENEQAFLMDIKCDFPDKDPIIVRLKSKLDNYTIDFDNNTITVNDLKTIGAILPKFDGNDGNFERFHYSRELAVYLWLLKQHVAKKYGMTNPHMKVNCLVVSTISGYYTKVYEVTNKEIDHGFKEFRYLLKLVAYYIAYEGYGLN